MTSMEGKTVLITGASRGIGAEAARAFAKQGANLVLAARGEKQVQALADEIGSGARAIRCDVARWSDVKSAVDLAVSEFGGLDVLIGNAGAVEPIAHLAESDPESWGHIIDINLKGIYYGVRAALPVMLAAGGGSIINISSGAAHSPVEAWSHYCASKAGAAMVTASVHKEYGNQGIRAMGLSPGTVATQMQKEIKASGINPVSRLEWTDHIPPEWVAQCCIWMSTAQADGYVGEEISLRDEKIRRAIGIL